MKDCEKLKEYRELAGLSKKDIVTLGEYPKSEQWYGRIENGIENFSEAALKECYTAINVARAKKQGIIKAKESNE